MVYLEKKLNTLVKKNDSEGSSFLNVPRTLTFTIVDEEGHSGYFSNNPEDVSIELEENIIFFKVKDTIIDNIEFLDAQTMINYIYDL
jgi:hypothetical protein